MGRDPWPRPPDSRPTLDSRLTMPSRPAARLHERRSLRDRKHDAARRALFDAAMTLFRERGFDDTTAEDIAARAGFSRATFFNHFGTKAAVLRAYGEQLLALMEETLSATAPPTPPLERLRRVLLALARHTEAHREDWRVVYTVSFRDPAYVSGPTPARVRFQEAVADLLAEAQRRGD